MYPPHPDFSFFFFNDTATTEIYTLSLHDALPIYCTSCGSIGDRATVSITRRSGGNVYCFSAAATSESSPQTSSGRWNSSRITRSEEHTSELQSQSNLVCRLLLEKKKKKRD